LAARHSTNIAWRNILGMMDQAYLAGYVGAELVKSIAPDVG